MPTINKYEKTLAQHLRAEALCAELTLKGWNFDTIRYTPQSSFKKSYRKDIDSINIADNGIELVVNRDGIYDRIPEGVFHQTKSTPGTSVTEMVAEHKRYKAEEQSARKFFNPFEQEFFRYSVMVEETEQTLTHNIEDERMIALFRTLWGLENDLPEKIVPILLRMLPWTFTVKGIPELTAKMLELILNKPVSIEITTGEKEFSALEDFALGLANLGVDTIAGKTTILPAELWTFTIQNVLPGEVYDYTIGKPYALLLRKFEDIFIPLDVDVDFEFDVPEDQLNEQEALLGYSLTI